MTHKEYASALVSDVMVVSKQKLKLYMKRIDVRAVGRDRTQEEKQRRHLHGDKGATFSKGKYLVLLGNIAQTITTLATKDSLIAEIYETA